MPDTALSLITDAMLELRVLRAGETPSSADANDGLRRLNRMLDALSLEQLACFADLTALLAYVASQPSYTVGPGGDFNMARPPEIIRAWVRDGQGQDIPQALYSEAEWDAVRQKTTTAAYPSVVFYDPQHPLGVLYVWPIAISTAYSQVIRVRTLLSAFPALTTQVSLPPGYQELYTLELAVRLAPYFGRAAVAAAQELNAPPDYRLDALRAAVKRQNLPLRMTPLANDVPQEPRPGRWNILTGRPNRE